MNDSAPNNKCSFSKGKLWLYLCLIMFKFTNVSTEDQSFECVLINMSIFIEESWSIIVKGDSETKFNIKTLEADYSKVLPAYKKISQWRVSFLKKCGLFTEFICYWVVFCHRPFTVRGRMRVTRDIFGLVSELPETK